MIAALPPRLRRAVSPYCGIVASVEECLASTTEPALFQAACEVGGGEGLLGNSLAHLSGVGGTGTTRAEAASAAVGEAIERYSATYVPTEKLVVAAARDLPGAVEPERFALFSDPQQRHRGSASRSSPRTRRSRGSRGASYPRGVRHSCRPSSSYLGDATPPGARSVGYATSSGLACGETEGDTLERALFELLERDAFMIVWAGRLSLPLLHLESLADGPFARTGLGYSAVDLSVFHRIPTILGGRSRAGWLPGSARSGGGRRRRRSNAPRWKALAEAFATRSAGAKLALLQGSEPGADQVVTFEDHIRLYADHARSPDTAFLDSSPVRTPSAGGRATRGSQNGGAGRGPLRSGRGRGLVGVRRRCHLAGCRQPWPDGHPGRGARALSARCLPRRTVPRRAEAVRDRRSPRSRARRPDRGRLNPDPHPFP